MKDDPFGASERMKRGCIVIAAVLAIAALSMLAAAVWGLL